MLIGAVFWASKRLLDIRLSGAHIIGIRVGLSQSGGCSVAGGRNRSCAGLGSFGFVVGILRIIGFEHFITWPNV